MDEQLREAFAQVRAEEDLKKRTLDYLSQKAGGWSSVSRRRARPWAMAAACAACMLMTIGSLWLYFTPAAYISVDVNPSVELTVNRFDRVISLKGLNDDGAALAEDLNVRFLEYTEALEQVLNSDTIADLLSQEETVSITVAGDDEARTAEMLSQVSACAAGRGNTLCHSTDLQTAQAAHDQGLSCGKYRMLLELQALDPAVTAEDIRGMTMKQLQAWLEALEDKADSPQIGENLGSENGYDSGKHRGSGQQNHRHHKN